MVKSIIQRSVLMLLVVLFSLSAGIADAGPLMDRIEAGETIRLGFANEVP